MATRPWLKFYPSDWQADPKLRKCSFAARGLWMEMLCIMQKAEPVGFLVTSGEPVDMKFLATLSGGVEKEVARLAAELEAAGVFSRDSRGVIFSRRMVRDEDRAARDKANGKKGGNPNLNSWVNPKPSAGVNPPVNLGGDKAHWTLASRVSYPGDTYLDDEALGGVEPIAVPFGRGGRHEA